MVWEWVLGFVRGVCVCEEVALWVGLVVGMLFLATSHVISGHIPTCDSAICTMICYPTQSHSPDTELTSFFSNPINAECQASK